MSKQNEIRWRDADKEKPEWGETVLVSIVGFFFARPGYWDRKQCKWFDAVERYPIPEVNHWADMPENPGKPPLRILTLRMKGKWWDQIASGEKTEELRRNTEHWHKRLIGREYDEIHLWRGYPSRADTSKRLRFRWAGVTSRTITHEEFGTEPTDVFAIDLSFPIESE